MNANHKHTMQMHGDTSRAKLFAPDSHRARTWSLRLLVICLCGMMLLCQAGRAANFATRAVQASGAKWTDAIWSNTVTASTTLVAPTAGNSYEVLTNALIRPPTSASSPGTPLVFPGDSLQFDAGGSIRLKSSGPPAPGYFAFNNQGGQLVLNGGELDAGDDMMSVILSTINVVTNTDTRINGGQDSSIVNISNGTRQGFRNFLFYGGLSGGGTLTFGNAEMYNSVQINNPTVIAAIGTTNANFIFKATSTAYAGTIKVTSGWLQAAAPGAFGSASIIIAGTSNAYPNTTAGSTPGAMGPAQFNATVAYSNPGTLTIQNTNSFLLLDTNLAFGGAVIDGFTIAYGTYTAAQLNAITGQTNVIDPTGNNNTLIISSNVTIVPVPPVIVSQTQSRTNYPGDTVQLMVVATGTAPLHYQWKAGAIGSGVYTNLVNGGNLTGTTNSVLTLTNITLSNQADYVVVVANSAGSVTSSVPTSLVIPPLTVNGPTPASATLFPGGTITFGVSALGAQPITYQWQKIIGGVTNNVTGATNSSLTLNNIGSGDAASYDVVVTTPTATTNSQLATLTLATAPADAYGQTVMSLGPVAYWRFSEGSGTNAFDFAGGHNAIYGASAFLQDPGPPYSGFPSGNLSLGSLNGTLNSYATLTPDQALNLNTNTVTITAWVNPLTLNPKAGIVLERNQTVTGDVEGLNLTTNNTLGYVWNNSAASLGWDSGLTLPLNVWTFVVLVVTPTNATIYMYNNSQQSSATLVTANAAASFAGLMNFNNDSQDATGARIFGSDTAEVAIYKRALSTAEVVQLFTVGTSIPVAPSISSQPQPQWVLPGKTAHFAVSAAGSSPISYQWQLNGVNLVDGGQISGSASSTLTITGAGNANAGQYTVVVGNSVNSITSNPAMLAILPAASSFQTNVLANGPLGYWPLNETSGTNAFDYSGNGYHGLYVTPTALGTVGPNPPYIGFDSIDNLAPLFTAASTNTYVSLPSLGVSSANMSFAAWIYPIGQGGSNQVKSAGIIFNRAGTTSGLCFNNDGNQIGYNWNNDGATYGHTSGLIAPTNQWSFVAVVVTPTNATLYLYNTNGVASNVNVNNHAAASFTGETRIGSDAQPGEDRTFNGKIEQAVIYNYSLSATQIAQVYTNGSGVAFPVTAPTNANLTLTPQSGGGLQLSWTAGTLLEATNLIGPWTTNTAASPYTVPVVAPQKFYRIRLQ